VVLGGRSTNLLAARDSGILAPAVHDERGYALRLGHAIAPAELSAWQAGDPSTWATESYAAARDLIYGEWSHGPGALPDGYAAMALAVVNVQLERAGVRLAVVLNAAFE
jgi:hypothetical protein